MQNIFLTTIYFLITQSLAFSPTGDHGAIPDYVFGLNESALVKRDLLKTPIKQPHLDQCQSIMLESLEAVKSTSESFYTSSALTSLGLGHVVVKKLSSRIKSADAMLQCHLATAIIATGDASRVGILTDLIVHPDTSIRQAACKALYMVNEVGNGVALRKALTDRNLRVRQLAAAALAQQGNQKALSILQSLMHHENEFIASTSAKMLFEINPMAQDIVELTNLKAGLTQPSHILFLNAILAARQSANDKKELITQLQNSAPDVRAMAAMLIGDARVKEGQTRLIELLDDKSAAVRVQAAAALVLIDRENTLPQDLTRDVFLVTEDYPRYTEASIASLRDGSLLYAISAFNSGPSDHAKAQIQQTRSYDGGLTWSLPTTMQENIGGLNVMSTSLKRLGDYHGGDTKLGHFFMVKNSLQDLRGYLRITEDEGKTFGDAIQFTHTPGYTVMNNDRIQRLSSGRLIAPVAHTTDVENINHFIIHCNFSDDGGLTWTESKDRIDYFRRGAMEPEVIEFNDGRLGMIFRTQLGHIGITYSEDEGDTWSEGVSWTVRSSESPATCRRIPSTGDLLLIWNDHYLAGEDHEGFRIPLTAAISDNEGKTWKHKRNLETGPGKTAAYASLTFEKGRALMSYTVRSNKTQLRSHRFRSLPISWFYENE